MFRIVGLQFLVKRTLSSNAGLQKYVAIIGSGPAGFYTAQGLLKADNVNTHVHVFEKLPTPFGLVRFGVAPDHPDVKNVINKFSKTASHKNFRFFGNIEMGKDITIDSLRKAYDAVVLAYGADSDKNLNIPGESATGVHSARSFVGWYNGLPKFQKLKPDLSSSTAVVIGHGNVAVDVARILLLSPDELAKTDISSEAVAALRQSKVKQVYLVGRRGPLQAAFTIAELRELLRLPGVLVQFDPEHFAGIKERVKDVPRPKRRLAELMLKHLDEQTNQATPSPDKKCLKIEFFKSPVEITGTDDTRKLVTGVRFVKTALVNPNDLTVESKVKPLPGQEVTISTGLVLKSIGYRGVSVDPALPFDNSTGTVLNDEGRVRGLPGVYCAGWIGRGAVGVIADTLAYSSHVAKVITTDLTKISEKTDEETRQKAEFREKFLRKLEEKRGGIVDWKGWLLIDAAERKVAEQLLGKPREKIRDIEEMIRIARGN